MADKYDILIENADQKKIIVYAGSSAYFSVDTNLIEEAFGGITAINMAVNAYFNGAAQMEIMAHYLRSGDSFIHAPEPTGDYQCLNELDMDDIRFFMALESNYDLLSLVDLRHLTHTLNSFTRFNHARERREAGSYLDCAGFIDGRGNYAKYRCSHGTDEGISDEAVIDLDRFSDEEAMDRLACYYESLTAKGVKVFFVWRTGQPSRAGRALWRQLHGAGRRI